VPRETSHRYRDPLDAIWEEALRCIGLQLDRTEQAYATSDGRGRLALATPAGLDPDDCVAQMALHELCHSLVQGKDSFQLPDWGLCNETDRDVVLEHACLRLQAALLSPLGLRQVLAPTTDYRAYYDALPDDPLSLGDGGLPLDGRASNSELEPVILARAGLARSVKKPWGPHLEHALTATRELVTVAKPLLPSDHLLSLATVPPARHPTGLTPSFARGAAATARCGDCAWAKTRGKSATHFTCVPSGQRVSAELLACAHYEAHLDCTSCGACCREAYDTVEVAPRDPARVRHAALMVPRQGGYDMARKDSRCVALMGGERLERRGRPARSLPVYRPSAEPFLCSIYEQRPKTCRQFTRGSQHCLTARRAVGLSH
jgi:Fe-S-cluster containining protein